MTEFSVSQPSHRKDPHAVAVAILAVAAAALVVNTVRLAMAAPSTPRPATSEPVAYTATSVGSFVYPGGTSRQMVRYLLAVRADGSYVDYQENLFRKTSHSMSKRLIVFASRLQIEVDEIRELKSSMMLRGFKDRRRDPSSRCLNGRDGTQYWPGEIVIGEEDVKGARTVKVASQNILFWFNIDVGCALMKQRIDAGNGVINEQLI